jgi:uncharacterized protein involved in exopolysaccharide biosynthesis
MTYREVFRSHRVLFLIPVVVAAVIALWSGISAPKMYRSLGTLWSDSSVASPVFGAQPPAGQDQQLLNELLTTRYFQEAVAKESGLETYLKTHPTDGGGISALLAKLKGAPSLDDRIAAALGPKRVLSNAKGPHVLEVSYDAPDPKLALKTLDAIVDQFREQRGALREDALVTAQKQVTAATQSLSDARQKLTSYLGNHPSANRSDPQLQSLAQAEREAVTGLSNATDIMNQATQAVATGQSSATVLRVIDAPELPTAPTAGKKKLLESVVLGGFAGGVISMLGIVYLARRNRRLAAAAAGGAAADTPDPAADLPETRLEPVE